MKAVFFDMDNTILDRTGSLRDFACWQARGMLRPSVDDPYAFAERFIELDENGAVWKDRVYATLLEEFAISSWTVGELVTSYLLCFSGFCKLSPGAAAAVAAVSQAGYRMAVVTNGKHPFQARNFGALGLSARFDALFVSEAVGFRKPRPEIFLHACDQLGVEPSESIFVGDNPVADIGGAKNVGMYTIYRPDRFGDKCDGADAVCHDLNDLPRLVEVAKKSVI